MNMIEREIKRSISPLFVSEKKERARMKTIGLDDLKKLNEEETLNWLKLGLDIQDDLSDFKLKMNEIIQMSIGEIKKSIPSISMESILKINRTVSKVYERGLEAFDVTCTKVLRENELKPIESLFKVDSINPESVDEIILSAFSDGFEEKLNFIKKYMTKWEEMKKIQKDYKLSDDELLIYLTFLYGNLDNTYENKAFKSLISRAPTSFMRCKNFILLFLSVLRKFTNLDEGTTYVKTKHNIDDFKVGEIFVFPSFTLGVRSDDDKGEVDEEENKGDDNENYKKEDMDKDHNKDNESEVILRISGKTKRGHVLIVSEYFNFYYNHNIILEPETSFKVTKIEKKGSVHIICGKFIEKESFFLEEAVKEFEKKCLELRNVIPEISPKYAERFPPSLSKILKFGTAYKGMTLKDAIRKANFADSEELITKAEEKKKKLQIILKDFDLSEEDTMAIYIYTLENEKKKEDSPYSVLNRALSNRSKETLLPLREYMFYLLTGLRKLPRFRKQEVLYRGLRMSKKELLKTYYEGRTLLWTTFVSTSTVEKNALKFTSKIGNKDDPDECGVIFEIHGKFRGYSISSFSDFAKEEEILLEPDTKFTVMMVEQDEKNPNMMRVVLSVKDEEPNLKGILAQFESCCEELIINKDLHESGNEDELGRSGFSNQEHFISPSGFVHQEGSSLTLNQEQHFNFSPTLNFIGSQNEQGRSSFSPMQGRGEVKATDNKEDRSSFSTEQANSEV